MTDPSERPTLDVYTASEYLLIGDALRDARARYAGQRDRHRRDGLSTVALDSLIAELDVTLAKTNRRLTRVTGWAR